MSCFFGIKGYQEKRKMGEIPGIVFNCDQNMNSNPKLSVNICKLLQYIGHYFEMQFMNEAFRAANKIESNLSSSCCIWRSHSDIAFGGYHFRQGY